MKGMKDNIYQSTHSHIYTLTVVDQDYSTTKLCCKFLDNGYLDNVGKIKEGLKSKINNQELKIKNSKLIGKPGDKFETSLFLPEKKGRRGEGGLRTKGYFKFSYDDLISENKHLVLISDKRKNEFKLKDQDITKLKFNQKFSSLPLISIITVVYNGENNLEGTIKSVINQDYPNVEYIIIDGGSTDGTINIIKRYENYIDYWVSEKDKGIYDAMNKGIKLANGELIGIINSDDYYSKDIFREIVEKFLQKKYQVDFFYGPIGLINQRGEKYCLMMPLKESDIEKYKYTMMPFPHPSIFIKLSVYKKIGLFNCSYKLSADYDLVLRLINNNYQGDNIRKVVAFFREGGRGESIISYQDVKKILLSCGVPKIIVYKSFFLSILRFALIKILPESILNFLKKIRKSKKLLTYRCVKIK